MFNHAPKGYICPICLAVQGIESEHTMARQADIVHRDDLVVAYVNSFYISTNRGHVIVVPTAHFENLYDLPPEYAHRIMDVSREIALAMKAAYRCDGIWIAQNNEPASGQHAFHYHMHIVPRYDGDGLMRALADNSRYEASPAARAEHAERLKFSLSQ